MRISQSRALCVHTITTECTVSVCRLIPDEATRGLPLADCGALRLIDCGQDA